MQVHIVFAPKYRRKILLQEYRVEMGKILRELCDWKGIKINEAEICPDHVHMFVEIPPKMSVLSFMGYLKGKSSVIFHEKAWKSKVQIRKQVVFGVEATMWIQLERMQSE